MFLLLEGRFSSFDFFASYLSRAFYLLFLVFGLTVAVGMENQLPAFIQLFFMLALIGWRLTRPAELLFVPDFFLICLPYFWTYQVLSVGGRFSSAGLIFLLTSFAFSSVFLIRKKRQFKTVWGKQILVSIVLAVVFLVCFSTALKTVFPPFSQDSYQRLMLNLLVFFSGFAICNAARCNKAGAMDNKNA